MCCLTRMPALFKEKDSRVLAQGAVLALLQLLGRKSIFWNVTAKHVWHF